MNGKYYEKEVVVMVAAVLMVLLAVVLVLVMRQCCSSKSAELATEWEVLTNHCPATALGLLCVCPAEVAT